jgi:hypothetical protein
MPQPTQLNISHYRGDSLTLSISVWGDVAHTDPVDLAGAIVSGQVRADPDDSQVVADLDIEVETNVIRATLTPKGARALPELSSWDVQVDWFGDDTSVTTVAAGKIVALPDVTRTVT